jgi:hypothetical protein
MSETCLNISYKTFFILEKTTYIWNMKKSGKILFNMYKASQREEAKSAGFYDGRFKPRVVESKKHKQPKHKTRIIEE